MWTKKLSYFLAGVFGVAAFQAVYTAFFFSDPQSINFSMPLAFGITLAPMALTFFVFTLLATLIPRFATDVGTEGEAPATAVQPAAKAEPVAADSKPEGKPDGKATAKAEPAVPDSEPDSKTTAKIGVQK
jgi:hypothetical protein